MAEYIDRQAVIDLVDKGYLVSNANYGSVSRIVRQIPAADVQPVRHGRWTDKRTIEHDGEWYCTACGKEITIYMGADRKDRYAYCPNCGARQDGDGDV